jgi:L-ascorbate metabolism protein UlaG (beta-lactamase superfamily)
MQFKKTKLLTFIFISIFTRVSLAAELVLEYTANAGVKVSSNEKVVLIDSLFGPHHFFNALNEKNFNSLITQGADIALSTHAHSDHFSAKRTAQFLNKNKGAIFIGTPEMLVGLDEDAISDQLQLAALTGYQSKVFSHQDIKVTAYNFPHMELPDHQMQNFGYLVEIGGWKILHVGDGDVNAEVIKGLELAEQDIDIALIHDLFPVRKKNYLELIKTMNVGKVAFVHMTDEKAKDLSEWLEKNMPSAGLLGTDFARIVLRKKN